MNSKICRVCLKTLYENDFDSIEDITKQMLNELLLKLNLNVSKEPLICKKCVVGLEKSFNYKCVCLNAKGKDCFIKYKENVNLSSEDNENETVKNRSEDHKVCRFCTRQTEIGCCTYLHETKENIFIADMIQKHIPELNVSVTQGVVTCLACLDELQSFSTFIMKCLEAEEKITRYTESSGGVLDPINLYDVQQFILNSPLKYEVNSEGVYLPETVICENETVTIKTEMKNEEFEDVDNLDVSIKNEEFEIKAEQGEFESLQSGVILSHPKADSKFSRRLEHLEPHPHRNLIEMFPSDNKNKKYPGRHSSNQKIYSVRAVKCEKDSSKITIRLCESCSFQTECRESLRKHLLTHKNPSEITLHQCESCPYQAKTKWKLSRHMQTHENVAKYQCASCSFQTKYKSNLQSHIRLTHRDCSEVGRYRCESCSYQTKYKAYLKQHMFIHEDSSEISVYQCHSCSFQTRYRGNIIKHLLIHKNPSETTMYQCESCSFRTKFKWVLKRHGLTHKNCSEVIMYQCQYFMCSFSSKYKFALKLHIRTHINPSDLTVYQCESCSFQTKYKEKLGKHLLTHEHPSEVPMYQCESCTYKTKRNWDLKKHRLTHKNRSKVIMYQCQYCSHSTQYKHSLKTHILTHKNLSNI